MTHRNKALIYILGILASYLFTWPVGLLMIFFFADMDKKIPTITE